MITTTRGLYAFSTSDRALVAVTASELFPWLFVERSHSRAWADMSLPGGVQSFISVRKEITSSFLERVGCAD